MITIFRSRKASVISTFKHNWNNFMYLSNET